jgi:malate dehydrogenase (oxaloacetate-decarboxylating)(NADP+)
MSVEKKSDKKTKDQKQAALDYHAYPQPGKLATAITKPADTQEDLSLAYSPGVAEPVRAIAENPDEVYRYTGKGNLVAVITNGTAILGLGNLGSLASKPVMEGKSLLFKRFAGIDSVDIQLNTEDPEKVIEAIALMADTFGGINLEDIRAPECFEIERRLIDRCNIPVFHDDQHGTAIVTLAGVLNALEVQGKKINQARMVCLGAGAAAIACSRLLIKAGMKRENLLMVDSKGVIYAGREQLNPYKEEFAIATQARTLDDAIEGADIFLGLSGANLLCATQLNKMAPNPIIFACSNPDPEISPELVHAARSDALMATGRSDYPNQVNNALGFPFVFRGALDVRARCINDEMKMAAALAIRDLTKEPVSEDVKRAYPDEKLVFGRYYIIPKPTDVRLLQRVSLAVALAAIESGVARCELPARYNVNQAICA